MEQECVSLSLSSVVFLMALPSEAVINVQIKLYVYGAFHTRMKLGGSGDPWLSIERMSTNGREENFLREMKSCLV